MLENRAKKPKSRKIAIFLAFLGTAVALPFPLAGIHKFYLGQPLWGVIYLLLWQTPIPRIACAIDLVWYFILGAEQFRGYFDSESSVGKVAQVPPVGAIAEALRELEQLRADGLVTEWEFEQKRRKLLEQI